MFNTSEAIIAQSKYCTKKALPHFAPGNGICWICNKNIYKPIQHELKDWITGEQLELFITGVDVEKASTELINRCPHCNRTYCS